MSSFQFSLKSFLDENTKDNHISRSHSPHTAWPKLDYEAQDTFTKGASHKVRKFVVAVDEVWEVLTPPDLIFVLCD